MSMTGVAIARPLALAVLSAEEAVVSRVEVLLVYIAHMPPRIGALLGEVSTASGRAGKIRLLQLELRDIRAQRCCMERNGHVACGEEEEEKEKEKEKEEEEEEEEINVMLTDQSDFVSVQREREGEEIEDDKKT